MSILRILIKLILGKNSKSFFLIQEWRFVFSLSTKLKTFKKLDKRGLKVLIGSSYADLPFPRDGRLEGIFNLGFASQDLRTTYFLYNYFDLGNHCNRVFNVIGVFSPGFVLAKTKESWRLEVLDTLLNRSNQLSRQERIVIALIVTLLAPFQQLLMENGFWKGSKTVISNDLKARVNGHLREYARESISIDMMVFKNVKNIFTPLTKEYTDSLAALGWSFAEYSKKLGFTVECLDLEFSDKEFLDSDHLNKDGSQKLLECLRDY